MKRVLVLALLCVFGLGGAAFAGPLSGMWDTDITFAITPSGTTGTISVSSFTTRMDIDYSVGGWVFGTTALMSLGGLTNLYFDASGTLGAFRFASLLDFDPITPAFEQWDSAGLVSIAGVSVYALFSLEQNAASAGGGIGTGYAIGGFGSAGDVKIAAEVDFNLASTAWYIWYYGFDWLVTNNEIYWSNTGCAYRKGYYIDVVQTLCTSAFTEATLIAEFPFTCFTLLGSLDFTCVKGFAGAEFEVDDVCLGLDWLKLSAFVIDFTVQTKSISYWFSLVLSDCVCLTPYLSLHYAGDAGGSTWIDGIELNAFTLKYTWNGVTFKYGDIIDATWPYGTKGIQTWGFDKTGNLGSTYNHSFSCDLITGVDEFIGIEVTGDSCCGGSFAGGFYNFFDAGGAGDGIFDWVYSYATLEYGIASNLSINAALKVTDASGLVNLTLGFKFTW